MILEDPGQADQAEQEKEGKTGVSSLAISSSAKSVEIYSAAGQTEKSKLIKRPVSPCTLSTCASSCRPRSAPVSNTDGSGCPTATPANCMGQGYEHPGPDHPCTHIDMYHSSQTPHSGICCCSDLTFINSIDIHDPKTVSVPETQLFF